MPGQRLSLDEREEIRAGLERGDSAAEIARMLERSTSTVTREVRRNGGAGRYRAVAAQQRAAECARRPKPSRLALDPALTHRISGCFAKGWSPAPIAAHLTAAGTAISHETIYRELYRPDTVFGDQWKDLCRPRPTKRRRRRTRTGRDSKPLGPIVLVQHRTADIHTEAGHWEGDLICGSASTSAAVVLTERTSRRTLLGALTSQTAAEVGPVVTRLLAEVPPQLRLTLCWDQGRELARWPTIAAALGIDVYFCQPRSPWQKPLVENACGHLRRWLPKKANLYLPQPHLDTIAHNLNTMPRRSLMWQTPNHTWDALVATTM